MSEELIGKPYGKILFGVDYIFLMSTMEKDNSNIAIAVIQLLLLKWGFSKEEVYQSSNLFVEKIDDDSIGESVEPAILRISNVIKDHKEKQKQLLAEMVCVGLMDDEVTDREKYYFDYVKEIFDLKSSEVDEIIKKGNDWASALKNLGAQFLEIQ